jgi:hypothetical protein
VLARLSDARVAQYWDARHFFAEQLGQKISADVAHPKPNCCNRNGTQLDEVAVYPREAEWKSELPRAAFLNGPVVHSLDFSKTVAELLSK